MVIQNGQRITKTLREFEFAFEVHLPKLIRHCSFETAKGSMLGRLVGVEQVMASEDRGDRARTRHSRMTEVEQTSFQLATSPDGMLAAQFGDRLFHFFRGAHR